MCLCHLGEISPVLLLLPLVSQGPSSVVSICDTLLTCIFMKFFVNMYVRVHVQFLCDYTCSFYGTYIYLPDGCGSCHCSLMRVFVSGTWRVGVLSQPSPPTQTPCQLSTSTETAPLLCQVPTMDFGEKVSDLLTWSPPIHVHVAVSLLVSSSVIVILVHYCIALYFRGANILRIT